MIIVYLCCIQGLSFGGAQALVTQKRPGTTPRPHSAFMIEQLQMPARSLNPSIR